MAARPMSEELIALTNKKLDMTLDELIKMSKKATSRAKKSRASIKNLRAPQYVAKGKPSKLRAFLDLRASIRQGALASKRSNFHGNHLPSATDAKRKVEAAPFRGRASNLRRRDILNKSRLGARVGQSAANGVMTTKPHTRLMTGAKAVTTQKPKTLDSLFANLRKQRVNSLPRQKSDSVGRNSKYGGSSRRRMLPWHRAPLPANSFTQGDHKLKQLDSLEEPGKVPVVEK